MRTTDVCPIPRMDTGTLIRSVIAPVRSDADDASRRRCALRCCGSRLARRVRPASATNRAPLAFPSSPVDCAVRDERALGERPRSIHVGPREREDATPTRNVSIRATARLHARWLTHAVRETRRRSLGDALDDATRTRDQVTPGTLGLLARDCGSAPQNPESPPRGGASDRASLVRLSSDPPDRRNRQPVAMTGVHPFTSLARPPLAWGLGPARECEQRASRARRLAAPGRRAPSLAVRVLDDESTHWSGEIESRGAVRATAIRTPARRLPDTPRRRIGCARRRNPTCTEPMGRRPSRSTERRAPCGVPVRRPRCRVPRRTRTWRRSRCLPSVRMGARGTIARSRARHRPRARPRRCVGSPHENRRLWYPRAERARVTELRGDGARSAAREGDSAPDPRKRAAAPRTTSTTEKLRGKMFRELREKDFAPRRRTSQRGSHARDANFFSTGRATIHTLSPQGVPGSTLVFHKVFPSRPASQTVSRSACSFH